MRIYRGRDAHYWAPPAQIHASGFPARGSYLGWLPAHQTLAALDYAVPQSWPPAGCIHHSDRGSQYAVQIYRTRLAESGLLGSMARRGNPYDNAKAVSFMKTLKVEGVYPLAFETFEDVAEQLPVFFDKYNAWRLHSALGYRSPNQFEEQNTRTFLKKAV